MPPSKCHYCDREIYSGILCRIHYRRWRKARHRLYRYVTSRPLGSCWIWQGGHVNEQGYGRLPLKFPDLKPAPKITASRYMLIIHSGPQWVNTNLEACHRCDNPICVNPQHLFWGTHEQNMSGYKP